MYVKCERIGIWGIGNTTMLLKSETHYKLSKRGVPS